MLYLYQASFSAKKTVTRICLSKVVFIIYLPVDCINLILVCFCYDEKHVLGLASSPP